MNNIKRNAYDIYSRYFIFSRTQLEEQKNIANKFGKIYKPKEVIVNGVSKIYTDIVLSKDSIRYTDAYVVIYGDIRTIKFTQ